MPQPKNRAKDGPRGERLVGQVIDVPGSTSNLGPGFDTLGLALRIGLEVRVVDARDDGRGGLDCRFIGTQLEGANALERGFRAGVSAFAGDAAPLPSLVLEVRTGIPMRAGLGSSAAALVAGLRLAERLTAAQPASRLLTLAASLEGHADNTSASLLGGFIVASMDTDGSVKATSIPWPETWPLIVATPAGGLETTMARAALPETIALSDAVFNLQRVARLVDAVHRADAAAIRTAFADRLHQPYRARLIPGLEEALTWSGEGLLGVFLSGAGPSLAAVVDEHAEGAGRAVTDRFSTLYEQLGLPVDIRVLRAHPPLISVNEPEGH